MRARRRRVDELHDEIAHVFEQTIVVGSESWEYWRAVSDLRGRGSRLVYETAKSWTASGNPLRRKTAARILSQLRAYTRRHHGGMSTQTFVPQSFELLVQMLPRESDDETRLAIIYGLGHLGVLDAVRLIVPVANHPRVEFRRATAFALGSFHEDAEARDALRKLLDDPHPAVREWAFLGIGLGGNANFVELRRAVLLNRSDSYSDARLESSGVLAKRPELRVEQPLIAVFRKYGAVDSFLAASREFLHMDLNPHLFVND